MVRLIKFVLLRAIAECAIILQARVWKLFQRNEPAEVFTEYSFYQRFERRYSILRRCEEAYFMNPQS